MNEQPGEPIMIAGAGLVGSLLSLFLARRGYPSLILERRADMRKEHVSAGRSINLAISARGIHALERLDLAGEALKEAVPMRGRMMHSAKGELTFQPYGRDESDCIYSISRGGLNRLLLARAEATGHVQFAFREKASSVDLRNGILHTEDDQGQMHRSLPFSALFGTDGAGSSVRQALAAPGLVRETQEYLDYGYKELTMPSLGPGRCAMDPHSLHIWPRGTFMLIALPNYDGSYTCTLFLPSEGSGDTPSFNRLEEPAQVRALFEKHFPDALALIPDLEEQFFAHPTGHMVTVKCEPWNFKGRTLLLGDAAHAIVPFFGQGMNCGFEDCVILDELIAEHGPNWERVFPLFSTLRKPQSDAIADMAVENFIEMRDKVGQKAFLLEKEIEKTLMTRFPSRYLSRYALVTFKRVPYLVALEAGQIQARILATLCRGLERADELDLSLADRLLGDELDPFLQPHLRTQLKVQPGA